MTKKKKIIRDTGDMVYFDDGSTWNRKKQTISIDNLKDLTKQEFADKFYEGGEED